MVSIYSISYEEAMDFNNPNAVIDEIHHALAENQTLIEVENGRRKLHLTPGDESLVPFYI